MCLTIMVVVPLSELDGLERVGRTGEAKSFDRESVGVVPWRESEERFVESDCEEVESWPVVSGALVIVLFLNSLTTCRGK